MIVRARTTDTTPLASPYSPRLANARTIRPHDEAAKVKLRMQARNGSGPSYQRGPRSQTGTAETKATVQPALQHWKEDTDLIGICDENERAKLPEDERTGSRHSGTTSISSYLNGDLQPAPFPDCPTSLHGGRSGASASWIDL